MFKSFTMTLACILAAGSSSCRSQVDSEVFGEHLVDVRSESQLKDCVYQTVRISGKALRTDKGNAIIDCGFEMPLEIPQIARWPHDLWNHTLSITGTLRWSPPFYVDKAPVGQTGMYEGSHPGYFYLADVRWKDLTSPRNDADAVALDRVEEMKDQVDKLVRIKGILVEDDQRNNVVKSKYYEFLVEEIKAWPQAIKGKKVIVTAILKKKAALTFQENGNVVIMEQARYQLDQAQWILN